MAAYSSGTNWSFPEDLPGGWQEVYPDGSISPAEHEDASNETHEPPQDEPTPKRKRTHYPPRQCRICLEVVQPTFHEALDSALPAALQTGPRVTYESEDGGRLLCPCKCRGSQKYVHEECLGAWRKSDPLQKRNYWECPTCGYRYRLQRLTWASWIGSTTAQISLTVFIFCASVFLLGFVADPIINLYLDPVGTLATASDEVNAVLHDDEAVTWIEHLAKGLAGLGLLGFAKYLLSLSSWQLFHYRNTNVLVGGRSGAAGGGTGRDRLQQLSWVTLAIGIATFLWAVWKGVRVWSRRTLESASERVMNMGGDDDDDDGDEDEEEHDEEE